MAASTVRFAVVFACALLASCGGGGGGGAPPPPTYTVGGTVTGLSGTGLVLRNNAGNDLSIAAGSSSFTFSSALTGGSPYNVTVATQPTAPSQMCAVTGGSGTIGAANVSTVQIACTTNSFTVGVSVTGLDADGLVLQNNGGDDLAIASDGTYAFPGQTLSGAGYDVTVKTQPMISPFPRPAQFCTATNGSGTVGNAAVNVAISCAAPVYKFLYVANQQGNTVSGYSIDASTGELTAVPGSPFGADVRPVFAIPEVSGRFLYVANRGDAAISPRVSAYTVDSATGALSELVASPFDFSVTPQPPGTSFNPPPIPFVHRSGAFAYATATLTGTGSSRLYGATINSLTGELTEINGFPLDVGFVVGGPAQDSGGRILFVTTNPMLGATSGEIRTFAIDTPSGILTPIDTVSTVAPSLSFPFVTPGDAFVLVLGRLNGLVEVFAVGKNGGVPNGVLTTVGPPVPTGPTGSRPSLIAFNRRNHVLYITNSPSGGATPSLATFRLDPSTGALTAIGAPISTNGATGSAILHPSGRFLLQHNAGNIQAFMIDPVTFAPTLQPDVSPLAEILGSFIVDFSGKYLYTSNSAAHSVSSYRVDTATGAVTLIHTVPADLGPAGVSAFEFQPQ